LGFLNENIIDKLRIQVYQSSGNNQFSLVFKKDLPLNSIVSREKFILSLNRNLVNDNYGNSSGAGGDGGDSTPTEYGHYSSFTHGNSLNDMINIKSRIHDKKKQSNVLEIFTLRLIKLKLLLKT
jgi:hypothetical protein